MGMFSRLHADVGPCPSRGAMGSRVIQFKFGDCYLRQYRVGDKLRWEAYVVGAPGHRRVLVSGHPEPCLTVAPTTTASTRSRSEMTASLAFVSLALRARRSISSAPRHEQTGRKGVFPVQEALDPTPGEGRRGPRWRQRGRTSCLSRRGAAARLGELTRP
jgi:hypothetical protein